MSNALVSVIIPVFNGEKFVGEAIESALGQTYGPLEIIVVDDGSTDTTADIAASYAEVTLIRQKNAGAAAARNTGIQASGGIYIGFLDHDDRWDAAKTQLQLDLLEQQPGIGFVLGTQSILLEPGTAPPSWLTEAHMAEKTICAGTGTLMVRRELFAKVGPFDPAYANGEDTDWFVRAVDSGFEFAMVEEAFIFRRLHGGNATYNTAEMRRNLLRIMHASVRRKRTVGDSNKNNQG